VPRISKQPQQPKPSSLGLDVASLLAACEAEAGRWSEVGKATRLGYEQAGAVLAKGWDLAGAAKGTRYHMRAAGLWVMRKRLRSLVREAKKLRKSGRTGEELAPVRDAQFQVKLAEAVRLVDKIREFQALPWAGSLDPVMDRRQKSHKQRAARDSDLVKFYEAASASSFLESFMVAEFSGCRGEELGKGVRVEAAKIGGRFVLSFYIESAKCDGQQKGIELRRIDVPMPDKASPSVRRRWLELARKAAAAGGGFVCKIDATAKQTAGQRFTNAAKFIKQAAGVDVMPYSLRHRYSSQVKQASGGDAVAVALALGHASTETQRHYGRAARGGGGVSPVQATGIAVSGESVRGPRERQGPGLVWKEKKALGAIVQAAAPPPARPRMRL